MTLLPPWFLDSVVSLGHKDSQGQTQWCATGFLYGYLLKTEGEKNHHLVYLVTNRHVFENQKKIIVRFNKTDTIESKEYELALLGEDGKPLWGFHSDPSIDYAVVLLIPDALRKDGINFRYFRQKSETATLQSMKDKGISEGDSVFVLGYPMQLVDPVKNYVIVRSGIIAKISDSYQTRKPSYIIDASVFPGNSGGPVITKPEIISIDGTKACGEPLLIGIVSSYLQYEDIAVSKQTGRPRVAFQENSGLAYVVPLDFLNEIIEEKLKTMESKKLPD